MAVDAWSKDLHVEKKSLVSNSHHISSTPCCQDVVEQLEKNKTKFMNELAQDTF